MNMTLSEIQKNSAQLDSEDLQLYVMNAVLSGECESYFEALQNYMEENDIEDTNIKKYLSPALYDILFKECANKGVLTEKLNDISIDEFMDD